MQESETEYLTCEDHGNTGPSGELYGDFYGIKTQRILKTIDIAGCNKIKAVCLGCVAIEQIDIYINNAYIGMLHKVKGGTLFELNKTIKLHHTITLEGIDMLRTMFDVVTMLSKTVTIEEG